MRSFVRTFVRSCAHSFVGLLGRFLIVLVLLVLVGCCFGLSQQPSQIGPGPHCGEKIPESSTLDDRPAGPPMQTLDNNNLALLKCPHFTAFQPDNRMITTENKLTQKTGKRMITLQQRLRFIIIQHAWRLFTGTPRIQNTTCAN